MKFNTEENDNVEEMVRIIIYDFISTNIYLIMRFEANVLVYFFYFGLNSSLVIVGTVYSVKNRFYYLDGISSFCTFLIFYALRKQWDYKLRTVLVEKLMLEQYFFYTTDYLERLNGFSLNVQNNSKIFFGMKLDSLMRKIIQEGYITDGNLESEEEKKIKNNAKSEVLVVNSVDNLECNEAQVKEKGSEKGFFDLYLNEFDHFANKAHNNDNITILFLKKLNFYRNYESQKNNHKMDIFRAQEECSKSKIKEIINNNFIYDCLEKYFILFFDFLINFFV
jgi:hypothetical protein